MTFLDLVCEEFIAMLKKYDVLNTYDIAVRRYKNYSVFDRTELLRHMGGNIINYSFSWVNVPIPQSPVEWRDMDTEWENTYRNLVRSSEARKLDPIVMYHGNKNEIRESNFGKFAWDSDSFVTCYTVGEILGGDNVEESIQDNIIVWPYSDTLLRHFSYFPSQIVLKKISEANILSMSPVFYSVISNYMKGSIRSVLFDIIECPVLNYIDLDLNTGKVSYLTKDKIDEVPAEERYTSRKRTSTTIGKMLVKLDTKHLIDKCDIEDISNYFRGISKTLNVQVWEGDDIKKAYLEKNYADPNECVNSTLHNSCMRYAKCQSYFEFYKAAHAKIAVLLNEEGKIETRALLWEVAPGVFYLDRIYYNSPFTNIRFVIELQKKYNIQYYRIDSRIFDGKNHQEVVEGFRALNYCIRTEELKTYEGEFPYVDTFYLYFKEEGCLYPNRCFSLHNTDGGVY